MNKKDKLGTKDGQKRLMILTISVVFIWGLSGIAIYQLIPDWSHRGTFGDMFGAVNALFSGLAFAALIYTIVLQREEIQLNRSEISMNRRELKKSASAQEEQAKQTHLAAKINAINTVINYYNIQISNINNSPELIEKARIKRRALIQQIDQLIEGLTDSEIE